MRPLRGTHQPGPALRRPGFPGRAGGEAPGENEDQQGAPFVGRAGQILNQAMEDVGLERSRDMITNTVKCRPPNNRDPE